MQNLQSMFEGQIQTLDIAIGMSLFCMMVMTGWTLSQFGRENRRFGCGIISTLVVIGFVVAMTEWRGLMRDSLTFIKGIHSHVLVVDSRTTSGQLRVDLSRDDGRQGTIIIPANLASQFPKGSIVFK